MKPARTALVVGQLPPPIHGSNVMTEEFLRTLSRLGQDYAFLDKRLSRTVAEVGRPTLRKFLRLGQLRREAGTILRQRRPDFAIYFIAASGHALLADAAVMRFLARRIPCFLYFHGRGYQQLAEGGRLWRSVVRDSLGRARGGVILSRHLMPDVSTWIPERRLAIIPNQIQIGPPPRRALAREGPVRLLFLSNLIPSKGAKEFLLAAAAAGGQGAQLALTIAGDALDCEHARELRQLGATLPANISVRFAGAVHGEEKQRLFEDADVFVFPTDYPHETFGLVNLEAMNACLPIIATNVGGIPDIVLHGRTGLIVEPRNVPMLAQAIAVLAGSADLRHRFGREGRRHLEETFSPERFEQKWSVALALMASDEADRLGSV